MPLRAMSLQDVAGYDITKNGGQRPAASQQYERRLSVVECRCGNQNTRRNWRRLNIIYQSVQAVAVAVCQRREGRQAGSCESIGC